MKTPILLVATATRWFAAARMPRSLAKAGFEVSLLAPKNSLAEKSRFVARIVNLHDHTTPVQWVHALAAMVQATAPRLVVPCDDMAFRLMQMLVHSPPETVPSGSELAALVRDSLGDPAWYRASVEKNLLPAAAEALGVRVPANTVTDGQGEARAFAAIHGYPVVLKRNHSSAGDGVRICTDPVELTGAFGALQRPHPADFERASRRLLVQEYIPGPIKAYHTVAWKGAVLAGYAAEKLEMNPPGTGPSTVQRFHAAPEIADFAARLARGFDITGFLSLDCVVDERTNGAYLLEINRRLLPNGHRGRDFDVDHCLALHSALNGTVQTTRSGLDPGEEYIGVHFPQEWLRDPNSKWLRDHPVDVPWDEPELLEAMLAMRDEP